MSERGLEGTEADYWIERNKQKERITENIFIGIVLFAVVASLLGAIFFNLEESRAQAYSFDDELHPANCILGIIEKIDIISSSGDVLVLEFHVSDTSKVFVRWNSKNQLTYVPGRKYNVLYRVDNNELLSITEEK